MNELGLSDDCKQKITKKWQKWGKKCRINPPTLHISRYKTKV